MRYSKKTLREKKRPFKHVKGMPVYRLLPIGTKEMRNTWGFRVAKLREETFYYCSFCHGWVSGEPHKKVVLKDDRKGIQFLCLRCGKELAFHGEEQKK